MEIKKVEIYSRKKPRIGGSTDVETSQHVIIWDDGGVYFTASNDLYEERNLRTIDKNIGTNYAYDIMMKLANYYLDDKAWGVVPGMGTYRLIITDSEHTEHWFYGSLSGAHKALSDYIAWRVGIPDVMLFGE